MQTSGPGRAPSRIPCIKSKRHAQHSGGTRIYLHSRGRTLPELGSRCQYNGERNLPAFLNYKREHELRLTGVSKTIIPAEEQEEKNAPVIAQASPQPAVTAKTTPKRPIVVESATNDSEIPFKIQILTSSKPLTKNDKRLKGLKGVDYYKEKGIYKYTYGASADYNKVLRTKRSITAQFKDAFIIAFRNGEKMNVNEAITEFKKRKNK